jgi:hypothetical protein
VYCRIERPGNGAHAPFRATLNNADQHTIHALRGIPMRDITVPISTPNIADFVASAAAEGFLVTIALDTASIGDIPSLAQLAAKLGEGVGAWRVSFPEIGVETLDPLASALKDAGSRGQLEVVLNSGLSNIQTYLATGLGRGAYKVFLPAGENTREELDSLRGAFEGAGYEGFRIQTIFGAPAKDDDGSNHWSVARDVLGAQALGNVSPEIDARSIFANATFGESYTLLSAMAHRLNGYEFYDELPSVPRARTVIFRNGDAWIAAMWVAGQPAIQALPIGGATDLAFVDCNNNPLALPSAESGSLRMALTNAPVYISGKGGILLTATARARARAEADAFGKNKAFQKELPPEFMELLKPITAPSFNRIDRVSFFALLRMFPVLEQKWHDGSLHREVAAPAMASLSRLVRSLCVIEQQSGEPFIELLQDTIARSGEYQSQYLTSTSGSAEKHERADWLLTEVARLTAEAKKLSEAGRAIEAVGVASLAEWRARSLEFARNANPLGAPEPVRVEPAPEPKPAPEKPAPTAKTPKPAQKKPDTTKKKR